MICARAWDNTEREYHRLAVTETGELTYLPTPLSSRYFVPKEWPVEWGFYNSNGEPFYHGDVLRIPWWSDPATVVHHADTKNSVPMFLYDYRPPKLALGKRHVGTCDARPAFMDSRIENMGSYREPRVVYARLAKPKPKQEPERVNIYAHIARKSK